MLAIFHLAYKPSGTEFQIFTVSTIQLLFDLEFFAGGKICACWQLEI